MKRSMIVRGLGSAFAAIFMFGAAGCQNKVHDENLALHTQNRQLQTRLSEEEDRLKQAPDPAQLSALQRDVADRDAKIAELQASLKKPAIGAPADPALAGIETSYDPRSGALSVAIPGDVLFDVGRAEIKPSAYGTLDKIISAVRKNYPGKYISVNGYTDRDPVSKTKQNWGDNWDLSYARAKIVSTYLTDHGVDSKLMAIVANGPNKAKATKEKSRRVEIVVMTK